METINELKALKEEYKKIFDELNAKLDNKIAELEKTDKRWKPNYGDLYFIVNDIGTPTAQTWENDGIDQKRYLIGNVFETRGEAEFEVERLKLLAELKSLADDTQEWNRCNGHWSIVYDFRSNEVKPCYNVCYLDNIPYFSSKEQAQKVIKTIGEDKLKKYYFKLEGVKE